MHNYNGSVGKFLVAGFAVVLTTQTALAQPQDHPDGGTIIASDYGSGASTGTLSNSHFNTPESDGRPGVKFFAYAQQALHKHDYEHAIHMYKVASSWAYKPAEYNLGLMYFRGQGVPVNRPLGAAWMVLAAERGDALYVKARDVMVTVLSNAEFAQTNKLWGQLRQTYSDTVALPRAKAQWAWVSTHKTGTRAGGAVGNLMIGVLDSGHAPVGTDASGRPLKSTTTAGGMMGGGSLDGSIAYRQFEQSSNPYDPAFVQNLTGTVKVGAVQQVDKNPIDSKPKQAKPKQPDGDSAQNPQN